MLGNLFTVELHAAGQLSADATKYLSLPIGATLFAANARCDADDSFLLNFGTAADPDAYIDDATITGAAATTVDIDSGDLVGGEPVHIAAGTELLITVDYDGGDGDSAANVSVVLFFREG